MVGLRHIAAAGLLGVALAASAFVAPSLADAPSTQRAGGYVIAWPSAATLAAVGPGDTVRVSLVRRAGARHRAAVVSLLRVASSGRPLAVVATRRMRRRGTFTARVPAGRAGRYRLRVAIGDSRFGRSFGVSTPVSVPALVPAPAPSPAAPDPCGHRGDMRGTLSVVPAEARPGQVLTTTLINTGPSCLLTGYGAGWQVRREGAWIDVPLNRVVSDVLRVLHPGAAFVDEFAVPQDAEPGRYRVGKQIEPGGPWFDVTAEVTVVP